MLPLKKILCPTDFSEASYEALKAANELALHFSAELCLVHVLSPDVQTSPDLAGSDLVLEEIEELDEKSLQDVVKQRIPKELHTRQIVVPGEAADEIIRMSEEQKADLIVIATHGQTGCRRILLGSVADKVVRLAPCPVLTIRAPHEQVR